MSNIKLGNGASIQSYAMSARYITSPCDCMGVETGMILSTMAMGGSNLHNLYPGQRCEHKNPIKAATVAYILNNYKEEAIKIKGRTEIKGWLEHTLKGSIALVFFRTLGKNQVSSLDLYLTNKLWIESRVTSQGDQGISDLADEMWIWNLGHSPIKGKSKHHSKSHHKSIVMF